MPLWEIEYEEGKRRPEGVCIVGRSGDEELMMDFMVMFEGLTLGRPLPSESLCCDEDAE